MQSLLSLPGPCCVPGAPPLAEPERVALAERFKALADPTRVAIVNRLAGADEVCVCVFVSELGLSQPTISHHLRILREAGLVAARRRGTWAYYRLVPEAVEELAFALGGGATAPRQKSLPPPRRKTSPPPAPERGHHRGHLPAA